MTNALPCMNDLSGRLEWHASHVCFISKHFHMVAASSASYAPWALILMCSTNLLGSKKRDFSFGIVGITDQFDDRRQTIQTLESIFDMMVLLSGIRESCHWKPCCTPVRPWKVLDSVTLVKRDGRGEKSTQALRSPASCYNAHGIAKDC